jgi:outer membrane protein OmpA-like peptidoglycan-associated protein
MKNFKATKLAMVIALACGAATSSVYAADRDDDNLINVKQDADSYNASADKSAVVPASSEASSATYSSADADVDVDAELSAADATDDSSDLSASSADTASPSAYTTRDTVPNDEFLSEKAATVGSSNEEMSGSIESDDSVATDTSRSSDTSAPSSMADTSGSPNQVHFAFDSAELSDEAQSNLDDLAAELESEQRPITISISGYTDATGPEEYNKDLAERRAKAVQDYLKSKNIEVSDWEVSAPGEQQPVASNESQAGRQENRRVEINLSGDDQEVSVVTD